MKRKKVEYHHTIPFYTINHINWHLENLWNEGFKCIKPIPIKQHKKIHKKKYHNDMRIKLWRNGRKVWFLSDDSESISTNSQKLNVKDCSMIGNMATTKV